MLFRPLPYNDSERLVLIRMERVLDGVQRPVRTFFPLADLADLQTGTHAFESVAFYSTEQSVLSHNGLTEMVDSASVSDSFFATVGGRIQSGRGFARSDENRASVVISDRLRRRLFGAENAVGRPLTIGPRSYEIIGVAHQTFQLPSQKTEVWLPAVESKCCPYFAIARLKPEVSQSEAAADVNAIVPALISKGPRVYSGARANRVDLFMLVFREGAKLAGTGLVLGVASSLAATRILAGLLYGIEPTDRFSFGLASGLLLLVAAAATYVPARRVSRLNPTVALRAE